MGHSWGCHSKVYSLKSETNKKIQVQESLEEFARDHILVLWEQETPLWPVVASLALVASLVVF